VQSLFRQGLHQKRLIVQQRIMTKEPSIFITNKYYKKWRAMVLCLPVCLRRGRAVQV